MDDLAERIKAAIENRDGELWFPNLTADLTARAWNRLQRDLGLTLGNYGTERVLSRNPSASREVIAKLSTYPSTCPTAPTIAIEALTPACAAQYQKQGVFFYMPDEILDSPVLSCIEEALAVINQVPSLMRTIATLVRSLHVIKPADEDHDVSFSEPHVPFSIFVSVPEKRIANDALRVAEAIVHETMHLQLTFIEQGDFLFRTMKARCFSPWRGEFRNSHGLLHALYVFRVIDRCFDELLGRTSFSASSGFMGSRRYEIDTQISDVESFQWCQDLTPLGELLVRRLLNR